jgi:teichuronic acid biosynthesis glycosyltransferase TuaC
MTRLIRTLLFSTLYPSSVRPLHGIFIETRLRELLKSGQVETRVVAPVPWFPSSHPRWGSYAGFAGTPRRERHNGIDVLHPRYPLVPKAGMTSAPLFIALAAAPSVRQLLDEGFDFDVIDAHYYYPDGVAAALLAKWFGKPLTITARGSDLTVLTQFRLPLKMMRWAAGRADASIGVCAALANVFLEWGVAKQRVHVMRNGVDTQLFKPRHHTDEIDLRHQYGQPLLLSVGRLVELKGHHLVIEALSVVRLTHPAAHLVIVGDGPEFGALQALVSRYELNHAVTFAGAVPQQELCRWYGASDLMILASRSEGWANVLLESMACGTPVLSTRLWGTPEVVTDERVGLLVDRRDTASLVDGIMSMLAAPRDRKTVRQYAEGFGWAQTTKAQLALFCYLTTGAK